MRNWYRKACRLFKKASMTLYIEDFPYTNDLTKLGNLTYEATRILYPYIKEFLNDQQFKSWSDKTHTEWFTPDGDDYFKNTGIINLYLPTLSQEQIDLVTQTAKNILQKLNVEVSKTKQDISSAYGFNTVRFLINKNNNKAPIAPPEISLANTNAYHIFRDILGYQEDLWDAGSFDLEELKKRIIYFLGETQYKENDPQKVKEFGQDILVGLMGKPIEGEEWKSNNIGDMLSGRSGVSSYTQDQTRTRLNQILEFCNWALSKGFKKAYVT